MVRKSCQSQISHQISLPKIQRNSPTSFCRSAGRISSGVENPFDQLRNGKVQKFKNAPQHTKKRLLEIYLQIPPGMPKKYEIRILGVFSWYFRGIFSFSCSRGNLDVGVVFLTYFWVWGFFFSVAVPWVVNSGGSEANFSEVVQSPLPLETLNFRGFGCLRRSAFLNKTKEEMAPTPSHVHKLAG